MTALTIAALATIACYAIAWLIARTAEPERPPLAEYGEGDCRCVDAMQMDPQSEVLAASADIAMEGGGEAEIKVGKKKVYTSKESRTVREVDADEMPTPDKPAFVRRVIARLWP